MARTPWTLDGVKALKHAFVEGAVVVGVAAIALGIKELLIILGYPQHIIHTVEWIHNFLILFTAGYVPARFWASLVVDDIRKLLLLLRDLLEGVSEFLRGEYTKFTKAREQAKQHASREDRMDSGGQEPESEPSDD